MEKHIRVTVPEPCHEKWDEMTPQDKGRFCKACSKVVVDFTLMTNSEIFRFFDDVSHSKVCGRFNSYQLNRQLDAKDISPERPSFFRHLRKIAAMLVTGLTLFLSSCNRQQGTKGKAEISTLAIDSNSSKITLPRDTLVKGKKIKQRKISKIKAEKAPAETTAGLPLLEVTTGISATYSEAEKMPVGDTVVIKK